MGGLVFRCRWLGGWVGGWVKSGGGGGGGAPRMGEVDAAVLPFSQAMTLP